MNTTFPDLITSYLAQALGREDAESESDPDTVYRQARRRLDQERVYAELIPMLPVPRPVPPRRFEHVYPSSPSGWFREEVEVEMRYPMIAHDYGFPLQEEDDSPIVFRTVRRIAESTIGDFEQIRQQLDRQICQSLAVPAYMIRGEPALGMGSSNRDNMESFLEMPMQECSHVMRVGLMGGGGLCVECYLSNFSEATAHRQLTQFLEITGTGPAQKLLCQIEAGNICGSTVINCIIGTLAGEYYLNDPKKDTSPLRYGALKQEAGYLYHDMIDLELMVAQVFRGHTPKNNPTLATIAGWVKGWLDARKPPVEETEEQPVEAPSERQHFVRQLLDRPAVWPTETEEQENEGDRSSEQAFQLQPSSRAAQVYRLIGRLPSATSILNF